MLDLFTVFSKGGIVLYSKSTVAVRSTVIDNLISSYFADARLGDNSTVIGSQKFHWSFANDLDLIFVVVYQKILQLSYIDELLSRLKEIFCSVFRNDIVSFFLDASQKPSDLTDCDKLRTLPTFDFDIKFEATLKAVETKYASQSKTKTPRRFEETKKYKNSLEAAKKSLDSSSDCSEGPNSRPFIPSPLVETRSTSNLSKGKSKKGVTNNSDKASDEKKKRAPRVWDGQVNSAKMKSLDYSEQNSEDDPSMIEKLIDDDEKGSYNADGTYEVKDIEMSTTSHAKQPTRFMSLLNSLTGQHTIGSEELEPILFSMKDHLISKNVANDIAGHLCDSVKTNIVGKKLRSFQSLSSAVTDSLRESITQILTPGASTDILKEVHAANHAKRPYVMAFIGVNGVGKSTNLSKTCFWLLQNKKRVLIAACDTFRSGAVEQLGVHVKNLTRVHQGVYQGGEVSLFQRGYGKDSAAIAKDAILFAQKNDFDVVLIDTAGRMQNNSSLMKALAKLVVENQPDKIIFVGEALVGNEAVDQLSKFNQSLEDFSGSAVPRRIDGIILTKFDTIDDKVGAALSMSFTSRAPILFVGTGQTYTDLKKMNVNHIVSTLLQA